MVCSAKVDGGLGVIDIRKHNEALLLKNLHKFFNKIDTPWVNLIWKKHYKHGKLLSHIKRNHSGGETISSCWNPSKNSLWLLSKMGKPASSRQTTGSQPTLLFLLQSCSLLSGISQLQSIRSSLLKLLLIYFISRSLKQH